MHIGARPEDAPAETPASPASDVGTTMLYIYTYVGVCIYI